MSKTFEGSEFDIMGLARGVIERLDVAEQDGLNREIMMSVDASKSQYNYERRVVQGLEDVYQQHSRLMSAVYDLQGLLK